MGPECRLFREEAFGPVGVLHRVAEEAEAADLANRTSPGLSSSVWTTDDAQADRLADVLEAAAVFVNRGPDPHPELRSGGIREFCSLKTVRFG